MFAIAIKFSPRFRVFVNPYQNSRHFFLRLNHGVDFLHTSPVVRQSRPNFPLSRLYPFARRSVHMEKITRPEMSVGFNQGENGHLEVVGEVRPRPGEGLGDTSGPGLGCTWDASGMHRDRSHWVFFGAFCSLSRVRGDFCTPWICLNFSGEGGIRTLDGLAPISVFETDAFDHSATSPKYLTSKALSI